MLQQTTVVHAIPYFERFTERWPTVEALAAAPETEVMAAWAGLGYYARARNLIACARRVAGGFGGRFPSEEAQLRDLPGVGAYTAAAIAAIAFDRAANVVDGNVERVVARIHALETPLPSAKGELRRLAARWVRPDRPGDWAQALMDLGAVICRPARPLCQECPLAFVCQAGAAGQPERYPRRAAKAARPRRYGVAYVARRGEAIAVVRRPDSGLLGGMLALPGGAWTEEAATPARRLAEAPFENGWREAGAVSHVFTHFALTLTVLVADAPPDFTADWWAAAEVKSAMPSLYRKALHLAFGGEAENAPARVHRSSSAG